MPSSSRPASEPSSEEQDDQDLAIGTIQFRVSKQQWLALQIRGFLDASEETELSAEVADDLIQTLPPDEEEDGEKSEAEGDEEGEVEVIANDGEITLSSVFNPSDVAAGTWTKQEAKTMLNHLKERGSRAFVSKYVVERNIPIPKLLHAFGIALCPELVNKPIKTLVYFLEVAMSSQLRRREKLPQYNTLEDAKDLISHSRKILVLTGAGISVSCGIPDFRSKNGLYATLKERGEYDIDDPQQMFDINYFRENPDVFYSFAREIYPSNFQPSPCHSYIKELEDQGKLLRNYTQNIDTLESKAGIERVIQCHGSFAAASCLACHRRVPGKEIEADILNQRVALCSVCNSVPPPLPAKKKLKKGRKAWEESESEDDRIIPPKYPPCLMKPDITFFGEKLDDSFDNALLEDRDQVDLLLVIGTSLKVAPVADILSHIPHSVPQILINRTPIRHINPDIVLLGDADEIIHHLRLRINSIRECAGANIQTVKHGPPPEYRQVPCSHVTLFKGAEGGKWLDDLLSELGLTTAWHEEASVAQPNVAAAKKSATNPATASNSGKSSRRSSTRGSEESDDPDTSEPQTKRKRKRRRVNANVS